MQHPCIVCSKPAFGLCNGCQNAWYCSVEHSEDDWPRHYKECNRQKVKPRLSATDDVHLYHRISCLGIPSVDVESNELVADPYFASERSYTPLEVVFDGTFSTIRLCDWHGPLPPNATPVSTMQWTLKWAGKRLVVVKHMKGKWNDWRECQRHPELKALNALQTHPNIISLYDAFLSTLGELRFVYEAMEYDLSQLIKSRKSRPFADGLVSSITFQIISGLEHIHASGYFHRDLKPRSILVSTTGLIDYASSRDPNAPAERDIAAIVKLGGLRFSKRIEGRPLYTQVVGSQTWYVAPEMLLQSRDYSAPVDMWALGTVIAELVNLHPLFPGEDTLDQMTRIGEVLGDPSMDYHRNNVVIGGGIWLQGIKLARDLGLIFPTFPPKDIFSLFTRTNPLIFLIRDLLKYDPGTRLTARQCLQHPYLVDAGNNLSSSHSRSTTKSNSEQPTDVVKVEDSTNLRHLVRDTDSPPHDENMTDDDREYAPSWNTLPAVSAQNVYQATGLDILSICEVVASTLENKEEYKKLTSHKGQQAQSWLNLLSQLRDCSPNARAMFLFSRALTRLCKSAKLYPDCTVLTGLEAGRHPVAAGSFGDVYKGVILGQVMSVKVIRIFQDPDAEVMPLHGFYRESIVWSQLRHPNILPLYGTYYFDDQRSRLCLVSPWMEHGNIVQFLRKFPDADRLLLALDIAQGIEYLHKNNIIHGDLKGVNILATPERRACITDFGLSTMSDASIMNYTSLTSSTSAKGGTARWQAPEILRGDRNSRPGDIYSFACVCYELFAGHHPFPDLRLDSAVVYKVVVKGEHPTRPLSSQLVDIVWTIMEDCWSTDPDDRPTAESAIYRLKEIPKLNRSYIAASAWDESFPRTLRSSLRDELLIRSLQELKPFFMDTIGMLRPRLIRDELQHRMNPAKNIENGHDDPLFRFDVLRPNITAATMCQLHECFWGAATI